MDGRGHGAQSGLVAGSAEDWQADPQLADIAREIVGAVKKDLSVDWTTHETREAAVRRNVRRLLRKKKYEGLLHSASAVAVGGGDDWGNRGGKRPLDRATELILQQARALYQYWPDVELDAPV